MHTKSDPSLDLTKYPKHVLEVSAALRRAAAKARQLAIDTNTPWVVSDEKLAQGVSAPPRSTSQL